MFASLLRELEIPQWLLACLQIQVGLWFWSIWCVSRGLLIAGGSTRALSGKSILLPIEFACGASGNCFGLFWVRSKSLVLDCFMAELLFAWTDGRSLRWHLFIATLLPIGLSNRRLPGQIVSPVSVRRCYVKNLVFSGRWFTVKHRDLVVSSSE